MTMLPNLIGSPLGLSFFERPTLEVAPQLVGKLLVVKNNQIPEIIVRITEVEAYLGENDAASHAYRGPTPRANIMFGPPGKLYVYLSYGINYCCNVICEQDGIAGAVLLRSGEILLGEDIVRARRSKPKIKLPVSTVYNSSKIIQKEIPFNKLLTGPGNFCKGLGIALSDNYLDLTAEDSYLSFHEPTSNLEAEVLTSPRIGISQNITAPYRFTLAHSNCLSRNL